MSRIANRVGRMIEASTVVVDQASSTPRGAPTAAPLHTFGFSRSIRFDPAYQIGYGDANLWKYVRAQLEVVADATGKDIRIIVIR